MRITSFESIVRIEEALIGHALYKGFDMCRAPYRDDRVEFDYHSLVEDRQSDLRPALGFDKRVILEVCATRRLPSKGHHVSRLGA